MGVRVIKTEEKWDDIDPHVTEGVETVSFAVNGQSYSIDLGAKNRERLEDALGEFVAKARHGVAKAPSVAASGSTRRPRRSSEEVAKEKAEKEVRSAKLEKIREWAKKNGKSVNEKGRIPSSLEAEFDASNA